MGEGGIPQTELTTGLYTPTTKKKGKMVLIEPDRVYIIHRVQQDAHKNTRKTSLEVSTIKKATRYAIKTPDIDRAELTATKKTNNSGKKKHTHTDAARNNTAHSTVGSYLGSKFLQ